MYKRYLVLIPFILFNTLSSPIKANSVCQQTPLKKSQEMIRFILNDLTHSYTHVGGGGISSIKQVTTYSYIVSISQEERIDQLTYELDVDKNCKISLLSRKVD